MKHVNEYIQQQQQCTTDNNINDLETTMNTVCQFALRNNKRNIKMKNENKFKFYC